MRAKSEKSLFLAFARTQIAPGAPKLPISFCPRAGRAVCGFSHNRAGGGEGGNSDREATDGGGKSGRFVMRANDFQTLNTTYGRGGFAFVQGQRYRASELAG